MPPMAKTIAVDEETHRRLREEYVRTGRPMGQIVAALVEQWIGSGVVPPRGQEPQGREEPAKGGRRAASDPDKLRKPPADSRGTEPVGDPAPLNVPARYQGIRQPSYDRRPR